MRALLQRVSQASVAVDTETIARIEQGLVVFLGIFPADDRAKVDYLVDKVLGLRVFADAAGLMNLSVQDVAGAVLVVSQFTLAADTRRGRRPGFSSAAPPEQAQLLYERFLSTLSARYSGRYSGRHGAVQGGRFGADMKVALVNDGPVTFLLETPA